ncbi:MAG: hypothetical protein GY718_06230 [Lentisphaerae bacterium]|nr:hypothetical protein [Lentisphaerota bacterium]
MLYANRYKIKKIISKDRLNGYFNEVRARLGECDLLDAYTYYSWNTLLSESLYASLQALEVSLRNSIQSNATQYFNNPLWFEDSNIIHPYNLKAVAAAKESLKKGKKNIDAGRIVAELNFGFWNSLFYARYEHILWRPLIKKVFPRVDPNCNSRKFMSARLEKIRRLRNRVFHFEPIWYLNLEERHEEIIEVLSWIEPAMVEMLKPTDRFPACCTQDKFEEIRESLKIIF